MTFIQNIPTIIVLSEVHVAGGVGYYDVYSGFLIYLIYNITFLFFPCAHYSTLVVGMKVYARTKSARGKCEVTQCS